MGQFRACLVLWSRGCGGGFPCGLELGYAHARLRPVSLISRGYEPGAVGRCTHWGESLAGWSFMAPRLIPVWYVQMVGLVYMTTRCAYRSQDPSLGERAIKHTVYPNYSSKNEGICNKIPKGEKTLDTKLK